MLMHPEASSPMTLRAPPPIIATLASTLPPTPVVGGHKRGRDFLKTPNPGCSLSRNGKPDRLKYQVAGNTGIRMGHKYVLVL
jgi:hypothetical protein